MGGSRANPNHFNEKESYSIMVKEKQIRYLNMS